MKKGDIFLHPVTKEKCEVTRFYGNKSWYFKTKNSNKEIRANTSAENIELYSSEKSFLHFLETTEKIEEGLANYKPIPIGSKVTIKIEELLDSKINRTEKFKEFLKNSKNTIFTVKDVSPHIVSLEETTFTFWEHHLNIVDNDVEKF